MTRARTLAAIGAGAGLMLWPALVNGYPLLFSDTGAFLSQWLNGIMVWDKPWIYGPVLGWVSLQQTLWLPALAQALLLSWLLWRVLRTFRVASPLAHVWLCSALALATAAPWFASLLMADILAPIVVLCLFLIGFGSRRGRLALVLLGGFAIAAHLAHLLVAGAMLGLILLLRPRRLVWASLPLILALAALASSNVVGNGTFAISPYGSVFLLARLSADGPVGAYLQRVCPGAGYALCAWADRLPTDSDQFMWDPKGPVWSHPGGPIALAPEAGAILRATAFAEPFGVLRAMVGNTATQLVQVKLDEVLGNNWLDETVGLRLRQHFPAAEYVRFQAARQHADRLRPIAAPLQMVQAVLLAGAALGCLTTLWLARRRYSRMAAFAALVLAAVLTNAFATGALSGPHDRYQARIAWLLWLPPLLYAARLYATMRATSAGAERTSAS